MRIFYEIDTDTIEKLEESKQILIDELLPYVSNPYQVNRFKFIIKSIEKLINEANNSINKRNLQ